MTTPFRITIALMVCLRLAPAVLAAETAGTPESGFTAEGDPYLGSPTAPVLIEEWSDYFCPFCARHFVQTTPQLIDSFVKTGQVRLVFRDFPIAALHPTARWGHRPRCVGEQGAARYWTMHDALFTRQKEWSRLPDPTAFLESIVTSAGFDTRHYRHCMESVAAQPRIEANRVAGQSLGFNGTPSFRLARSDGTLQTTLDGAQPFERFEEIVRSLLRRRGASPPCYTATSRVAHLGPAGRLGPRCRQAGFNVAGDPYKGNTNARLTVIEFSDYQCAGCAKHAKEVQPLLDREFVATGEVLWIVKALPLKEHRHAVLAAAAAECAGDQQQFWSMHEALFAAPAQWANDRAEPELIALAHKLDLDPGAFSALQGAGRATCAAGSVRRPGRGSNHAFVRAGPRRRRQRDGPIARGSVQQAVAARTRPEGGKVTPSP